MNRADPSRRSLKKGSPLGVPRGCQLGPLRKTVGSRRIVQNGVINCDRPAVRVVAGVRVCEECAAILDAIKADAEAVLRRSWS